MASIHGSTYFVTGDWSVPRVRSESPPAYARMCVRRDSSVWGGRFKHAKKIVVEEPPESMDALRELLSKEVCVRVGRVYYMDPGIQFLVEVKAVSDLKDMCQLQVEQWEPAVAAAQRLQRLGGTDGAGADKDQGGGSGRETFSWGFGDEPAHRPSETWREAGGGHVRGLPCGAASGWTYVEESELGTVVALNVGGKLFTSSYDTFTRVKDSLLAGMLCGRFPVSRDAHGNIFIDRDPKLFRAVLNYLRDETLTPPKDKEKVEALLAEARYFQLPDMERMLQDAWKQTCVLLYYAHPLSGLVHTLHIDGPVEVIKGIRSAVSEVLGSEHCTYALDGTMLTLELDAAHHGVEVPSHAVGSFNHPHSLLSALQGQGWEVFSQEMCGVTCEKADEAALQSKGGTRKSAPTPAKTSSWLQETNAFESNAVSRALSLGGGALSLKADTEARGVGGGRSSIPTVVTRYLLHR